MLQIEKRRLGGTGLTVSAVGIGTAAVALPYGVPGHERPAPSHAVARRTLEVALEAGITLIDTAPSYGNAEELVGEVIANRRDSVVATKLTTSQGGWAVLSTSRTRAAVRAAAEASLERLGREAIDLMQVHNADRELIELGVIPEALAELRGEGLISATGATVYEEADALAVIGSGQFDSVQISYNPLDLRPEHEVIPRARERSVGVIARSILLRGVLSPAALKLPKRFAQLRDAADRFRRSIAAEWDELPGAALAFVLTRPGISSALIGPRDATEVADLLAGASKFIDRASELRTPAERVPANLLDPRKWPLLTSGVENQQRIQS